MPKQEEDGAVKEAPKKVKISKLEETLNTLLKDGGITDKEVGREKRDVEVEGTKYTCFFVEFTDGKTSICECLWQFISDQTNKYTEYMIEKSSEEVMIFYKG